MVDAVHVQLRQGDVVRAFGVHVHDETGPLPQSGGDAVALQFSRVDVEMGLVAVRRDMAAVHVGEVVRRVRRRGLGPLGGQRRHAPLHGLQVKVFDLGVPEHPFGFRQASAGLHLQLAAVHRPAVAVVGLTDVGGRAEDDPGVGGQAHVDAAVDLAQIADLRLVHAGRVVAERGADIGVRGGDVAVRVGVQTDRVEADETEVRRLPQIATQQVNGLIGRERVGFVHCDRRADDGGARNARRCEHGERRQCGHGRRPPDVVRNHVPPVSGRTVFFRRREAVWRMACVPGRRQYRSTFGSTGRPSAPNRATHTV